MAVRSPLSRMATSSSWTWRPAGSTCWFPRRSGATAAGWREPPPYYSRGYGAISPARPVGGRGLRLRLPRPRRARRRSRRSTEGRHVYHDIRGRSAASCERLRRCSTATLSTVLTKCGLNRVFIYGVLPLAGLPPPARRARLHHAFSRRARGQARGRQGARPAGEPAAARDRGMPAGRGAGHRLPRRRDRRQRRHDAVRAHAAARLRRGGDGRGVRDACRDRRKRLSRSMPRRSVRPTACGRTASSSSACR